jgi:hypothetical protein
MNYSVPGMASGFQGVGHANLNFIFPAVGQVLTHPSVGANQVVVFTAPAAGGYDINLTLHALAGCSYGVTWQLSDGTGVVTPANQGASGTLNAGATEKFGIKGRPLNPGDILALSIASQPDEDWCDPVLFDFSVSRNAG